MKKNIAIICGGQSVEHDVSLMSASNVIRDLDTAKFNKIVIYITTQGQWLLAHDVPAFIVQAGKMRIDTSCNSTQTFGKFYSQIGINWNVVSPYTIDQ